ncbi:exopolysaccharide biosynthesis protein [Roseateles sp. BYS180W]|uniref:Exopolysaccharide biosynthesis protein n=1 Tax=Roseateles rivi TaxID=3299028 RepID=A0ABW7FTU1_9BURK
MPSFRRHDPACQLALRFRKASRQHQAQQERSLTLEDLLQLHGQASAAVVLMLVAMASVMPIAGIGTALSLVIFVLAWRWQRSGSEAVLPQRVAQTRINPLWTGRSLKALAWMYASAGRLMNPRWQVLLHRRATPWWSAFIALMGFVILLPLPFGNVLPALSLMLLSLGWMFRDGLTLMLAAATGSGAVAVMLALGHLAVDAVQRAAAWLPF